MIADEEATGCNRNLIDAIEPDGLDNGWNILQPSRRNVTIVFDSGNESLHGVVRPPSDRRWMAMERFETGGGVDETNQGEGSVDRRTGQNGALGNGRGCRGLTMSPYGDNGYIGDIANIAAKAGQMWPSFLTRRMTRESAPWGTRGRATWTEPGGQAWTRQTSQVSREGGRAGRLAMGEGPAGGRWRRVHDGEGHQGEWKGKCPVTRQFGVKVVA
ncbi:hypothetical protein DFH06DRAFT_1145404 [Mycena polygramma]|nr:hypothetical protein DFH06DRAFT_1145404 [Mycena polygramma]